MVRLLIDWVMLSLRIGKEEQRDTTPSDFCKYYGRRKVQHLDAAASEIVKDIDVLLNSERPHEIKQKTYDALKYRWGLADGEIHKLKESGTKWNVDVHMLLSAEMLLISRLGWQVKLTQTTEKRWLSL